MRIRALLCCVLLLFQPLAGIAMPWQSAAGDSAAHCEAMAVQQADAGLQQAGQQTSHGDEAAHGGDDCLDSCDLCAACALSLSSIASVTIAQERPGYSPLPVAQIPPGVTRTLYRPPISS